MTKLIGGMTISLDGYVALPDGDIGPLYTDADSVMESPAAQESLAETGSAMMGRRFFDMAEDPDGYAEGYEFQCPIVVVTHEAPARIPARNDVLFIEFATDGLEAAVDRAKELAGDKDVTVLGGPDLLDQLLAADLVDELRIDVMPVILGGGRRFLEGVERRIDLETLDVGVHGPRTSLHLAVRR
ncbi:MAG TPA: dihydrofolate reductase family protein [Iamia sp.]